MNHEQLIRQNGILLKFINVENRTYEICYCAVENNPKAIKYVPAHLVDDAILELVFDAGESFIKHIPRIVLSEFAYQTIKYQYPHIAIEMGIAPMIYDGAEERQYIDNDYFDCLFNQGEGLLMLIPTEFFNNYAIGRIKAAYPKLACDLDLLDVVLDAESTQTYMYALQIIAEEANS